MRVFQNSYLTISRNTLPVMAPGHPSLTCNHRYFCLDKLECRRIKHQLVAKSWFWSYSRPESSIMYAKSWNGMLEIFWYVTDRSIWVVITPDCPVIVRVLRSNPALTPRDGPCRSSGCCRANPAHANGQTVSTRHGVNPVRTLLSFFHVF